jgi:phosphate uptake regulator
MNDVLSLCGATGLVVGLAVYLVQLRRRRKMKIELELLRADAVKSAARIEEMQRYASEQAQHLTNAFAEREALLADSRSLRQKLRERDNEIDDVPQPD